MKKALIMGITGTFGRHVAQALAKQGWQLSALQREPKNTTLPLANVELHQGSAADIASIRLAAADVELIVYGVNPPNYDWESKAIPWLENTARVAEEKGLTLVFPGNVYPFDPKDGPLFSEASPMHPPSRKGQIRLAMEQRLQQASQHGARVIIVRAGDFIAADAKSAWLPQLIKANKTGYTLSMPGPASLNHTWAYVPDLAHTIAELVERRENLSAFEVFHFSGHQACLNDIARAISEASGRAVKQKHFPWWLVKWVSPFSVLMKGLQEMSYLWKNEVSMTSEKLQRVLGTRPVHTPLKDALVASGVIRIDIEETAKERLKEDIS